MARGYRFGIVGSISTVPDGSTVTPTDDITIWIKCAKRSENYTTLTQVLADSTCLIGLMTNDNACNYLVRSTTWVTTICANENAMKTIGASDYATDSLLADNTWRTAICNSSYYTAVLNVKVPTMTSNTTPSGEAFASVATSSGHDAYMAFDGNTSTTAVLGSQQTTGGYGYDFGLAVGICKASADMSYSGYSAKVQNSDDKTNWNDISIEITNTISGVNSFISNIYSKRRYNRISFTNPSPGSSFTTKEIQFYGRVNGGIQDWLRTGGITNKDYVTLAEVLADSTTLATLIANHNAMDYLVTAKGLIDIVNDSTAMSLIGLNNYASDTLLNDSTWFNAICNSTYFESILNAKVPIMTSNTTPSGEVIVSSYVSGMEGYKAFDNNTSTYWRVYGNNLNGAYIIYHFTTPVSVNKVVTNYATSSGTTVSATLWELFGSNNNTDYIDIGEVGADSAETKSILINNNKYTYYKLVCKHANVSSSVTYGFRELQFYGRVDV